MKSLIALLAVAILVPAGIRADDRQWEEDNSGGWSDDRPDYDVSVDLDVSGNVNFDTFNAPLSSYGDWVVVANHGRVWRPRVAAGWRPYYYGRWEWTNEGWLWVSDEPWGWAAYHYGRWTHDPYYGWIWVPGYEWAPAWVSWRYSGDAIGWAPLAPGFSLYVSTYPFIDFWWTFVPTVRFVSVPVYTVAFAPVHTRQWFHRTAPAPARPARRSGVRPMPAPGPAPAPAWGGPAPRLVSERMGRPLTPVRIVPSPAPGARGGRAGEVHVYRPDPRQGPGRGRGPDVAPAPGRGGERAFAPAPQRGGGEGRGPGAAPAPGWSGREREDRGRNGAGRAAPPPAQSESRGGGVAAPPPARSEPRGGGVAAPPPARSEPRGGGAAAPPPARGGGDRGGGRGEGRGEGRGDHRASRAR